MAIHIVTIFIVDTKLTLKTLTGAVPIIILAIFAVHLKTGTFFVYHSW
jgi:hypothetical protein